MLKRSFSIAIISISFACSSIAAKSDDWTAASREQSEPRAGAVLVAQSLFDQVVSWICENFDLPITHRPNIRFATKAELTLSGSWIVLSGTASYRTKRNSLPSVTWLLFMTRSHKPSTFRKTGPENQLLINRFWFTRWSTISRSSPGRALNVQLPARKWPTSPRISGWNALG